MRHRSGTPSHFPRAWARVHRLGANGGTVGMAAGGTLSRPSAAARSNSRGSAKGFLCLLRSLFSRLTGRPGSPACAAQPSREARLQAIAFKLETILDELDEIGAQRIAIDVCMALERVKAQLVADDATAPCEPADDP